MNWLFKIFKRKKRKSWAERPLKKPYTPPIKDKPGQTLNISISGLAEQKIAEFGEDKRLHFLASILATQDPELFEYSYQPANIIYGAMQALELGINKEYEDKGYKYRVDTRIENGTYIIINELLDGSRNKLDEGDILANIAGISISMFNQAIGRLILLGD